MSRSQAASLRDRVAIDGAKSSIQDVVCMRFAQDEERACDNRAHPHVSEPMRMGFRV